VADGLAIPFGVFRSLLDRPAADGKQTVFEWMEVQYAAIQALPSGSAKRGEKMEALRRKVQKTILNADPGANFRNRLRAAMEKVFGVDGTYGVFVRSDTNVEDLPGFTGAGLNKTIPNVVGFDHVIAAIPRVWASPFSKRAFAWRQSHMDQPQHVYASVLLLRSVPSEKSGVMVTRDIDTGDPDWISVAVNEGVGGAVDGQAAESLRINLQTGKVRRLAQATASWRRVLKSTGGVGRQLVQNTGPVLLPGEIKQLIELARGLPQRYPVIVDAAGNPAPADVEFGFVKGKLQLFQIRPFLESARVRGNDYLNALDRQMDAGLDQVVNLSEPPSEGTP
jgi:phosphoenolpyruvate synthase/pyruvate phosphate dikinase